MAILRMDNVLIVVDDLQGAKTFFIELGLKLEGEATAEGPLVGRLIGFKDVRATLAMMQTPDGQGIDLDKFQTPEAIRFGPVDAPVNTLGVAPDLLAGYRQISSTSSHPKACVVARSRTVPLLDGG